jgi:hypothetical protein
MIAHVHLRRVHLLDGSQTLPLLALQVLALTRLVGKFRAGSATYESSNSDRLLDLEAAVGPRQFTGDDVHGPMSPHQGPSLPKSSASSGPKLASSPMTSTQPAPCTQSGPASDKETNKPHDAPPTSDTQSGPSGGAETYHSHTVLHTSGTRLGRASGAEMYNSQEDWATGERYIHDIREASTPMTVNTPTVTHYMKVLMVRHPLPQAMCWQVGISGLVRELVSSVVIYLFWEAKKSYVGARRASPV